MSNKKVVSKKYVSNRFTTVGLSLIVYSLFALYVPFGLKQMLSIKEAVVIKNGINIDFLTSLVCLIVGTILPFCFLRKYNGVKLKDFFSGSEIKVSSLLVDYAVFFTISTAAIYLNTMLAELISASGDMVSGIGINFNTAFMNDYLYLFAFIIVSPLLEEYAFRGVLLNCLSRYGKHFAIIALSIVYALAHGSIAEILPSFVMSYFLSKIALRYKSIKPTIILHILFNATICALSMIPEKYSFMNIVILAAFVIMAVVLVITRAYKHITIRKSKFNNEVLSLFFLNYVIIASLMLFVLYIVISTIF